MKLEVIRTYQAVPFENQNHTFFMIDDPSGKMKGLKIEILSDLRSIRLMSSKDEIIVPFDNISYMKPAKSKPKVESKSKNVK